MTKWNVDPAHTTVGFSVRHMMITNVRGEFGAVSGTAELDPQKPAGGRIEGAVDVTSISTREPKRDEHLKSADFFDAEHFPQMTFRSTTIEASDGGIEAHGTITIRGTERPVVIYVEELSGETKDPWGGTRIGATAHATVKRSDFGLTWNQALEAGGMLVGDEVKLSFELSLVRA